MALLFLCTMHIAIFDRNRIRKIAMSSSGRKSRYSDKIFDHHHRRAAPLNGDSPFFAPVFAEGPTADARSGDVLRYGNKQQNNNGREI